jgi:hypothetical protein
MQNADVRVRVSVYCSKTHGEWTEFFVKKQTEAQQGVLQWQPPQNEWIMITTERSYGEDGVALHMIIMELTDALLNAIAMADHMRIRRPVFARDYLVMKQALMATSYDDEPLGALFREVK